MGYDEVASRAGTEQVVVDFVVFTVAEHRIPGLIGEVFREAIAIGRRGATGHQDPGFDMGRRAFLGGEDVGDRLAILLELHLEVGDPQFDGEIIRKNFVRITTRST